MRPQLQLRPAPSPSPISEDWIERRAKLFECGAYPDKGVTIVPADLQRLATGFNQPVPVLIEHAESPLEMGMLVSVEPVGEELFGNLRFSPEANALIERSGAKSLSVGISADLSTIREVSLVRNPRVPTAQIFHDGDSLAFFAEVSAVDYRREYERLRRETLASENEKALQALLREAKILPAEVPFARALLEAEASVTFSGARTTTRELTLRMFQSRTPHAWFTETATAAMSSEANPLLLPEETAFYRQYFPEIPIGEIAKNR